MNPNLYLNKNPQILEVLAICLKNALRTVSTCAAILEEANRVSEQGALNAIGIFAQNMFLT